MFPRGVDRAHTALRPQTGPIGRKARIACGAVRWGYATAGILAANKPDFMFETPVDIIALR